MRNTMLLERGTD